KWFGPIPSPPKPERNLPKEPVQTSKRILEVEADVPASALYMTCHMPGRFDKDFYPVDLMGDVLARGQSSRFYERLVKEKEIFTSLSAFSMGSIDPGMLVINGRVRDGISLKDAEAEVMALMSEVVEKGPAPDEVEKVRNQALSTLEFGETEVMNRAMNLA